jgi:hypothetical protein
MKKADSMLLKAFLLGLPAVIIFAAFSYSYSPEIINHAARHIRLLYNFGGFALGAWMMLALPNSRLRGRTRIVQAARVKREGLLCL